jgi:hypothetical protein
MIITQIVMRPCPISLLWTKTNKTVATSSKIKCQRQLCFSVIVVVVIIIMIVVVCRYERWNTASDIEENERTNELIASPDWTIEMSFSCSRFLSVSDANRTSENVDWHSNRHNIDCHVFRADEWQQASEWARIKIIRYRHETSLMRMCD